MKKYIGTKEISATPAWRVDDKVYPKDRVVPRVTDREDGYKVIYENGHESWLPKDVFEKTYRPIDTCQDRMKIVLLDLQYRIIRIMNIIYSEEFSNLPSEARELIKRQYCEMKNGYFDLKERIELEDK